MKRVEGFVDPSAANWFDEGIPYRATTFTVTEHSTATTKATLFISENGEQPKVYTEEELAQILMRLGDDLRFRSAVTRSDFEDALTALKLPILP